MSIRSAVMTMLLLASALSAQTQVADVATEPMPWPSNPTGFVQAGNTTYFLAHGREVADGFLTTEIWKTDGTRDGTQLVVDLSNSSTAPRYLGVILIAALQGELYFLATMTGDKSDGLILHLWRTDASTGGIVPVKELPGFGSSFSSVLADGKLYFSGVGTSSRQTELWVSDGTSEGTHALTEPQNANFPYSLTVAGGDVYFIATSDSAGREIWKTDGTVSGTNMVIDLYPGPAYGTSTTTSSDGASMAEFDGELYFSGRDGSTPGFGLWKTDGTAAGTVPVADIDPSWSGGSPNGFVVHDGALYFRATDAAGQELWKTDGTTAGTVMVKDINPLDDSHPKDLTSTPLGLIFVADDGSHGAQPWISDGTTTGTKSLGNLPTSSGPYGLKRQFTVIGNEVYFIAHDFTAPDDLNLYKTDGTPEGTNVVQGDHGGAAILHSIGNQALFAAHGDGELWSVSGAGTQRVKNLASDAGSLPAAPGASVDGLLDSKFVFSRRFGPNQTQLWVSDGTPSGTSLLSDSFGSPHSRSHAFSFLSHDGLAYFTADNGSNVELWRTNGTSSGTMPLTAPGGPRGTTAVGVVNDKVASYGYDDGGTPVIGTTNGTTTGTSHFVLPSLDSITSITVVGGKMYFEASTTTGERELWVSDGTRAGTMSLASVSRPPLSYFSLASRIHVFRGEVYFVSYDSASGYQLRKTDGTPWGTVFVSDWLIDPETIIRPTQSYLDAANTVGRMIFASADNAHGVELWTIDRFAGGAEMLLDICPGTRSSSPKHLTHYKGRVYFSANTPNHGRELWVSDGTALGTRLLRDICPGILSSTPAEFFEHDGLLYFSAINDTHGRELWKTDGTADGTVRVSDINPGRGNASPADFFEVDGDLYFLAYRPSDGREFWRLGSSGGGGDSGGGCVTRPQDGGTLPGLLVILAMLGIVRARGARE